MLIHATARHDTGVYLSADVPGRPQGKRVGDEVALLVSSYLCDVFSLESVLGGWRAAGARGDDATDACVHLARHLARLPAALLNTGLVTSGEEKEA